MNRFWLSVVIGACIVIPQLSQAASLPDSFPRLGNYYLDPYLSDQEATALAQWDIVIVGLETHYTSPNAFKIMKEINPDIIILAYVTSEEVPEKHLTVTDVNSPIYKLYNQLNSNDDLFLKTTSGQYLYFWSGSRMLNVTGSWNSILPTFMTNEILKQNPNHWDGIFFDNCFNDISWLNSGIDLNQDGTAEYWKDVDSAWKGGMSKMMANARKQNPKAVLLCNSNGKFYADINGRLIEAFPSDFDGGWTGSMNEYFSILKTAKQPSVVVVNSVANSFDAQQYQKMRYNLTSTLMGNGFASFDASIDSHNSTWWYDEYSVALGQALGGAFNVRTNVAPSTNWQSGVYRRNFERGIVLVNSSNTSQRVVLEDGFEKILGTQDVTVNNGKIVGSVTIPAHDGIILQGRIAQVVNNPYINGTFAKVLSARGKTLRNSFFSYNSNYGGSEMIVRLEDKRMTVVGGETYVTVYKGSSAIARFAPYGTGYRGGVNVAVGKLQGEKKGYSIVTGMQSGGSQVRTYSLRGHAQQSCYPYGAGFRGGVNVAVGDVLPTKTGSEIVVGPGNGGGPLVKVLNKRCKDTGKQWMAYNSAYRSGVWVAAGDVDNDGKDDIVTVPGPGAASFVRTWSGRGKEKRSGFYAFPKTNLSGAQVAVSDVDGNGKNELIAMSFSIFNE